MAAGDYLGFVVVTMVVVVEFEVVNGPFGVVVVEEMPLLLLVLGSKGGENGGGFRVRVLGVDGRLGLILRRRSVVAASPGGWKRFEFKVGFLSCGGIVAVAVAVAIAAVVVVVFFEKAPCKTDFVVFCASCFLVGGGEFKSVWWG